MTGSSREFFNGPCVPEAAIRAKSSEGFSPRWYYRKRSDVLLYRDAVVRDPIDGYGRAARYLVLLGRTKESIVKERRRHRVG